MFLLSFLSILYLATAETADDVTRGVAAGVHETISSKTWKINPASKSPVKVFDSDGIMVARVDRAHSPPNPHTFDHLHYAVEAGKKLSKGQRYRLNKRMRVNADAATGVAQALKSVGDVIVPLQIAYDVFGLGSAMYEEGRVGCKTVRTGAAIGGSWYGGLGGASAGASIGSVIPIAGTFVGGLIGGIAGSIYGSNVAEGVASTLGNCD